MLLTVITSDWEYHQKQTTQKVPNKRKQSGQEKEVSFSEYGTVDSLFTVIMSETENNVSNKKKQEGTTDPVNNDTISDPSQSTPKCQYFPIRLPHFSQVIIHNHYSSLNQNHSTLLMCELFYPLTVISWRPFTNSCWYEHLQSENCNRNTPRYEYLEKKKAVAIANDGYISKK